MLKIDENEEDGERHMGGGQFSHKLMGISHIKQVGFGKIRTSTHQQYADLGSEGEEYDSIISNLQNIFYILYCNAFCTPHCSKFSVYPLSFFNSIISLRHDWSGNGIYC